jgi:hypothetical protein
MRLQIISVLLCLSSFGFGKHPGHLSVVNMEMDKDSMKIEYSIRIFHEDYNYLVYGIYHDEEAASRSDSTINMNKLIVTDYIQKKFLITLDGNMVNPEFEEIKTIDEDVWLYFTLKLDRLPESMRIQNKIFVDLFRDQINLLILACNSKESGFTFDFQNTEQLISLKNIYQ